MGEDIARDTGGQQEPGGPPARPGVPVGVLQGGALCQVQDAELARQRRRAAVL